MFHFFMKFCLQLFDHASNKSSIKLAFKVANNASHSKHLWRPTNRHVGSFLSDICDPLDGFFNPALTNVPSAKETTQFVNSRIDWKETPEAYVFKADLQGVKKEEVKVEVEEGNMLHVSGETSKEQEEKKDKWHRVKRSRGKLVRRFRLPENGKMDEVKASMENGVLTVTSQGGGEEASS